MVVDQLTSIEIEFAEEVRALLLLQQMPESWNQAVTSISNSFGKEKLKFNEVVSMILIEEIRRKTSESSDAGSSGSALSLEQRGRSQKRGDQNQNQNRNRSKSKNGKGKSAIRKIKGECWNCGQTGHMSAACRAPKKDKYV